MNKSLVLAFLLFVGCKPSQVNVPFKFDHLQCSPEAMPKYDGNKVTLLDDDQNPIKDTIISTIDKRRDVFKPCRIMTYRAIWKNEKGEVLTNSRIRLMAEGIRWGSQPEKQDEITLQYEFNEKDIETTKKHQLNKGILDRRWANKATEGVIENVEEVWMHPFRFNQYNFTEVAPFPEVRFPLKVGKTWNGGLRIMDGWGDWENSRGYFQYEVMAQEDIKTTYGMIQNCWRINSEAKYEFGDSKFEYWFHEQLGFVKMEYVNYGQQSLYIELEAVRE